jgi:hypothetical protein
MKTKKQRGGYRPGSGRKSAEETGVEKRVQVNLTILPSALEPFKKKYGRAWSRRAEELIQEDNEKINPG